ncbi:DUF6883 domain-containing protein [Thermoflexus sp.]
MPLPNAGNAYVPLSKITRYLLSETHSVGRAKARFFRALGFNERPRASAGGAPGSCSGGPRERHP